MKMLIKFITILFFFCLIDSSYAQISGVFSGQLFSSPLSGDYETYATGQDGNATIQGGTLILGQTFTPSSAHRIDYVYIYALRGGSPGNVKIDIYATSGGLPTSTPIATSGNVSANGYDLSFVWQKISLTSGYNLSALTTYAIVLSGATDQYNYVEWGVNSTGTYAGGKYIYSTDNGANWLSNASVDCWFREGQN
jgi:hypothetical protein